MSFLVPALLVFSFYPADPEPAPKAVKPRLVAVSGLPTGRGDATKPIRIENEKKLAELVPDKEAREVILNAVDFKKEHLLLFSWSGSGGDRIGAEEGKAGEAAFTYSQGLTDDLRRH